VRTAGSVAERELILTYALWPTRLPEPVAHQPAVTRQQRALVLREEGLSLRAIGRVLGVHASTVRLLLERAGGDPSPARRGRYVSAGERDQRAVAVVALRAQGWTFARIGQALGVSAGTARWSAVVHGARLGLTVPRVAVVGADGHRYDPRR
jgi:DNA-binding NarL/FixJ family response regulator